MTPEEEITHLRAENQALREALTQTQAQLSQVLQQLQLALAHIEELENRRRLSFSLEKSRELLLDSLRQEHCIG